MQLVFSLDLGKEVDYAALAITEIVRNPIRYHCRDIRRFPIGTSYTDVILKIGELGKQLDDELTYPPILVIDVTGSASSAVNEMARGLLRNTLKKSNWVPPVGITIKGSGEPTLAVGRGIRVAKTELIVGLQVAIENELLKVAPGPFKDDLIGELGAYRAKKRPSGIDDWRTNEHDDLIFALALGVFQCKRIAPPRYGE